MRKKLIASGIILFILGILTMVILLPNATPTDVLLFHIIGHVMSIVGVVLMLIGLGTIIAERL